MRGYDAVVVGLGGMGSAAAAHLARRGKRVVGLDQYALGHDLGASTGRTRVIRKAYFEGLHYVPLLDRSFELWRELEVDVQMHLVDLVGALMVGSQSGPMLEGVRRCVETYGIDIEEMTRTEVRRRYPTLHIASDELCLYEAGAGIVFPELGIRAHQVAARSYGAELRGGVRVRAWSREASGSLRVDLDNGEVLKTDYLILCAGPWTREITNDLHLPITVQRNVQVWYEPKTGAYARGRFPTFFLDRADLPKALYGFPDLGDGVKAALHCFGEITTPRALNREVTPADIAVVRSALNEFMPGAAGAFRSGKVCMYALTPDENFIVDRHPRDDGVIVTGGFSGHGYKFCPVIGEIVADLVDGVSRHDISAFGLQRFSRSGAVS